MTEGKNLIILISHDEFEIYHHDSYFEFTSEEMKEILDDPWISRVHGCLNSWYTVYELPNGVLVDDSLKIHFEKGEAILKLHEFNTTLVHDSYGEKDYWVHELVPLKKLQNESKIKSEKEK